MDVNGILTYAGDSNSLAWGLLEVLRNPDLGKRLAADAIQKVKHIYNWKMIAQRTLQVYDKVLSEANVLGSDTVASTPKEPVQIAKAALPPGKA